MAEQDPTKEEWRAVVGYEGFYEVSDLGRIRSLDMSFVRSTDSRPYNKKGRLLEFEIDTRRGKGYLRVTFSANGRRSRRQVHHVVLESFVGPCPDGHECDHKNFVTCDNRLANLRWFTHKQNVKHSDNSGRRNPVIGKEHPQTKLSDEDVRRIRELRKLRIPGAEVASMYGIHRMYVYYLAGGGGRKHVE